MTIKEAAARHHVTPQAVYKRLKAVDISVESLRAENSLQLTPQGEQTVANLFTDSVNPCSTFQPVDNELKVANELKAEVERLLSRVADLEAERDAWRNAAETAQRIADQAQRLDLAHMQALPAPRASVWQRLTSRIKGESRTHT